MLASGGAAASHRPAADDPLFTAPTVAVEDPAGHDEIDDVVYGDAGQ